MRCPFCESPQEPIECTDIYDYVLMQKNPDIEDYDVVSDVAEFQCMDCGQSFWI